MTGHLTKAIKILLLLVLAVVILFYAKPFLAPIAFAAVFAMLLHPVSLRLEKWGMGRGLAIFFSVLMFIIIVGVLVWVLAWQISDISTNSAEIERNLDKKITELKDYIADRFGISRRKQTEIIQEQQKTSGSNLSGFVSGIIASFGGFLTDLLLVMVYTFLFLYLRTHLNKFVLMLAPANHKKQTQTIIDEAKGVAQKYLTGLSWMILCLWIMYSIGFSIVGVKYAVLFAILCGLLEIVPFVGNLTGNAITVLAVLMQGGSGGMIMGVLITYAVIQFIQTYLLEPLVVGRGVSINPLFTIAGLVAGQMVWGIPGMVLAIPFMGIIKIICDHVEPLKPYGFLIGEEKKSKKGLLDKIKGRLKPAS